MNLVAWNLAHQCREDAIKPEFSAAIAELAPDVLLLNEYVHGSTREQLVLSLSDLGLSHLMVSQRLNGNNQILIASRFALELGDLLGPSTRDQGGKANFLHVRLPTERLELVGLRAPAYVGAALRTYWDDLVGLIRSSFTRNIAFIGDFNTDPDSLTRATARHLRSLREEGWSVPSPTGEWSYISRRSIGTRIDHIVASPSVNVISAHYISQIEELLLASPRKSSGFSDHAPLVVRIGAA